jgi:hypothetical protein
VIGTLALAVVSVVTAPGVGEVEHFAAQELVRYVEQVTGEKVVPGDAPAAHRFLLGDAPASSALKEDGFTIRRRGRDVVIEGRGSRGVLYGCYAYLEHLGVRWYFPGHQHEIVPHRAIDWNERLDISESPGIRDRIVYYWPNNYIPFRDWIDFAAKARLNRFCFHYGWPARDWYISQRERLLPELRKRGFVIEAGGHLLPTFLPRSLFAEHPDWFRRNPSGVRTADFNFNPFHPEALDRVVTGAVSYLSRMPEVSLFHLWPDDLTEGGWSHEPSKEEYSPSDQALLVMNRIVSRLREKRPDAQLVFLSYHDTLEPPRVEKPTPGIVYFFAPRERCYAHSLDDPACGLNRRYREALEKALPLFGGANAEVFEYYVDEVLFQNMANPPLPEVMSADTRYYRKLGISRLGTLAVNTSAFPTPAVNMFLYPRALWNPDEDLNRPLAEYASAWFGDATMAKYFQELKRGLASVVSMCEFTRMVYNWYSPEASRESGAALQFRAENMEQGIRGPLTRAAFLLDSAIRRAGTPMFRQRLAREKESLDYTLIQSRLYCHLQRGERAFRLCRDTQDPGACLAAARGSVLANYYRGRLERFVGQSGLRGEPILGDPAVLAAKLRGLARKGFLHVDPLGQHLPHGISGATMDAGNDSAAVLYTDIPGPVIATGTTQAGIEWRDEFGQSLAGSRVDLARGPAIVEMRGNGPDRLIDAVMRGLP